MSFRSEKGNLDNMDTSSRVPPGTGLENSLQVTLNDNYDDYFYTSMDTTGYMVHIFYPYDFPDEVSGSLTEILVNFATEALIDIQVDVIRSSDDMKALPVERVSFKVLSLLNGIFFMFGDLILFQTGISPSHFSSYNLI